MYQFWLDPIPTSPGWTIDAVLRRVLGELLVPGLLKTGLEEFIDMLDWNRFFCTALWRHMLGVFDGYLEDSPHAGVTHVVLTLQLRRLGSWSLFIQTGNTFNTSFKSSQYKLASQAQRERLTFWTV